MRRKLDQWTSALTAVLLVGALLACKKKAPDTTAPTGSVTALPTTAPPTAASVPAPTTPEAAIADVGAKLGDVKRYPDKEKAQTGTARILADGVKVFDEADDKTADVATLDKDLLVFRLASIPDWELVEFPSGVGKVSPGWVPAKSLDIKSDATVNREAVATQTKTAVVKAVTSAAPKASAVASTAKPTPSASAAAATAAAASAQAAALASARAAAAAASAQIAATPLTKAQRIAARAAARAAAANSKP
jgi:hypothetical protein